MARSTIRARFGNAATVHEWWGSARGQGRAGRRDEDWQLRGALGYDTCVRYRTIAEYTTSVR